MDQLLPGHTVYGVVFYYDGTSAGGMELNPLRAGPAHLPPEELHGMGALAVIALIPSVSADPASGLKKGSAA